MEMCNKMLGSFCKFCEARILWAKTVNGKNIPVDYDQEIEYLWHDGQDVEFDFGLMISHFATCPRADKYRTPQRRPMNDPGIVRKKTKGLQSTDGSGNPTITQGSGTSAASPADSQRPIEEQQRFGF